MALNASLKRQPSTGHSRNSKRLKLTHPNPISDEPSPSLQEEHQSAVHPNNSEYMLSDDKDSVMIDAEDKPGTVDGGRHEAIADDDKNHEANARESGYTDSGVSDIGDIADVADLGAPVAGEGSSAPASAKPKAVAEFRAPTKSKAAAKPEAADKSKDAATIEAADDSVAADVDQAPEVDDEGVVLDPALKVVIQGSDLSLPPMFKLREIVQDLVENALKHGLQNYVDADRQFFLSVGTVCSGTDAPLHVLNMFSMLKNVKGDQVFTTVNKFACEIEPFKQAFLLRNSKPNLLFRDATEFAQPGAKKAHLVSGALADIPEVDIFVAGTSCVDFSTLNTRKTKEFGNLKEANNKWDALHKKKGKELPMTRDDLTNEDWRRCIDDLMAKKGVNRTSTTTFASAMNYIKERQPKLVIFENVFGAPWKSTTDYVFPLTGYAAVVVGLDTKDYYLPQTRLRKYVIAFNVGFFGVDAAKELCEAFKLVIEALERKYSSPVTDFLLPSNSHELHRARNEMELASQSTQERDTDWAFSRSRHTQFRRTESIPDERPWIQWRENGSSNAPAKMWKAWEARQPNRVKDLLECFYGLAMAGKNKKHGVYDPAHKAQILDCSQNVDRVNMAQPFGGTGCLTPCAIPFLSLEARPITGSEALKLQGMPIENFDMSIESQAQLQDLAGNAMSTTVVGAVILSALATVAKYDEQKRKGWLQKLFQKRDFSIIQTDRNSFALPDTSIDFGDVHQLDNLMLSAHTSSNVAQVLLLGEKTRRRCVCQHILAYSSIDIYVCEVCGASLCKSCKGNPEHQMAKSRESFHDVGSLTYAKACDKLRQLFPSILPMLANSQCLAGGIAQALRLSAYTPKQADAYAEAVVASLCDTTYELSFIEITDATRIEYVSKDNFILRVIIEKDQLTWYLHLDEWSDAAKKLGGEHKTGRPIARAVLQSDAPNQFPTADTWELWIPQEVNFCLTFSCNDKQELLLEAVGDASQIHDDDARTAILDLEGSRWAYHPECGMPERAFWVSDTLSKRLYMFMDVNPIGPSQLDCFVVSYVCREMGRAPQAESRLVLLRIQATNRVHKMLNKSRKIELEASVDGWWTNLAQHSVHIPTFKNDLAVFAKNNFPVSPPASIRLPSCANDLAVHGPDESCHRDQVLLSMSLPIFGQSKDAVHRLIQTMRDFDLSQQLDLAEFAHLIGPCYTAVERAIIGYTMGSRSVQLWDVVLEEDCGKCAPRLPAVIFEKSCKKVHKSIAAIHDARDESVYTQSLKDKPFSFRIDHNVLGDVLDTKKIPNIRYVDIRFVGRAHTLMQQARSYLSTHPSYHGDESQTRATFSIGLGVLEDPRLALAAVKVRPPPPATSELQPVGFNTDVALLPEQLASLNWMISRENDEAEVSFTEKEIAEVYIDHLRLRIYAQASRTITRRGRIVADDVGFGKTAVCLGLIDRQRLVDEACQMRREQDPSLAGRKHLKATLAIVPNHLTQQWKSEADRFLNKSYKILVLETYSSLLNNSDQLGDADIIICSNQIFKCKTYKDELLKHHDTNGIVVESFPKTYQSWYKKVLAHFTPPSNLAAKSAIKLLEHCTFARVIWDEFPYENIEVSAFVANCVTESKWMLSGTPPLASLGQVCKIAYLFNVHLARPLSLVAGRQPKVCENGALEPLSQLEEAQLYQSRPSPDFLQERHDQLLYFLRKFFSGNRRESTVQSSQNPVVVSPSSNSLSAYQDLQQDLTVRNFNANLVGAETRRRLMGRLDWKTKKLGVDRAVEALALRASLSFADVKERMQVEEGDDTSSPVVIAAAMYKNSIQTIEGLEDRGRELFGKASYLAYRVSHVNVRNHVSKPDNGEARQFSYFKTLQMFKQGVLSAEFDDFYRGWDAFESAMRILIWDEHFEQELAAGDSAALPLWSDKPAWKAKLKALWESMCFGVITEDAPAPRSSTVRPAVLKKKLDAYEMFREFVTKTPLHSRRWFGAQNLDAHDFRNVPHLLQMEYEHKLPWEVDYRTKNGSSSALVPVRDLRRPKGDEVLAPFNLAAIKTESRQRMKDAKDIPKAVIDRVIGDIKKRLGVPRVTKAHWDAECVRRGLVAKSGERVAELQERIALADMGKASEEHWITPQGCALKYVDLPDEGRVRIRGGTMEKLFDELMHTIDALTIVIGRLAPAHGKKNWLRVISQVLAGTWRCDAHPEQDAVATHFVSLTCGHVHCSLPHHNAVCGVRGCSAPLSDVCSPLYKFIEEPRIIHSADFDKNALVEDPEPYLAHGDEGMGPKINAVIGLIKAMATDDQIVVFVQNTELLSDMYDALKAANIAHVTAAELAANESTALESFKDSSKSSKKKQVLAQLINAEQAAGSNLHIANHVMFVSPLITRNQVEWDAQMKQALGRCIRFRQLKKVHVYHMATADTIEVDTLEWRHKKEVLLRPGRAVGRFHECEAAEFLERFDAPGLFSGDGGEQGACGLAVAAGRDSDVDGDDYVSVTMARSKDTVESANAAVLEAREAETEEVEVLD